MTIGWISDFNSSNRGGGAQITDRYVIDELKKQHDVLEYGIHNVLSSDMMLNCDMYVVSNCVNLYKYENARNLLKIVQDEKLYIRFVHDYDESMNENDERTDFIVGLTQNATQAVFLSPKHKNEYCRKHRCEVRRSIVVTPYIDTKRFQDMKLKRQQRGLALGETATHKGFYELYELAQKAQFHIDFYTFNFNQPIDMGYLHIKPAVSYDVVPYLFNIYHEFFHFPQWVEPFGRTIAEAYLSGIRITCNKPNVGFYSHAFTKLPKLMAIQQLQQGTEHFAEVVNDLLTNK